MHMADALISPAVGAAMYGVSIGANAYAVKSVKNDGLSDKKIPVMGVMGAFVFAAQMVNFTIPFTGSSGHIAGGVLLAALLGGSRALLSVTCVLIIQCLFFADGGLLALGCNIFNMGVIPCLIVYPLIFKPIAAKFSWRRLGLASVAASVSAMLSGAFCVTAQTYASGVTALPFKTFLLLMLPIHLAIGLAEGVITAAVLCFINETRPEIMSSFTADSVKSSAVSFKRALIALSLAALFTGGVLSLFASKRPDGLEWSVAAVTGGAGLQTQSAAALDLAQIQEKTAFMPDYDFIDARGAIIPGTSAAGLIGGVITCAFAAAVGALIWVFRKRRGNHDAL